MDHSPPKSASPSTKSPPKKTSNEPAFPLPDWLGPLTQRPHINIGDFVRHPPPFSYGTGNGSLLKPDSLPVATTSLPSALPASGTTSSASCGSNTKGKLSSVLIAALQTPHAALSPRWTPRLPTWDHEILRLKDVSRITPNVTVVEPTKEEIASSLASFIEVAVYDAEAPSKSVELCLPCDATLLDLIDLVPCTARATLPSASTQTKGSAVVFIEGALYADHRYGNFDYEGVVAKFLSENGETSVRIVQLAEHATRISELCVRLGQPYVFLHHGDCEHALLFIDVYQDYNAPTNSQSSSTKTGYQTWRRSPRILPCDVCKARMAVKFTVADPWADIIPFHYCSVCFRDAHYTREGKLFSQSGQLVVYDHPELT